MTTGRARNVALALTAAGLAAAIALRAKKGLGGFDFGGKSVIVTGGSRGLGLVLARQLAAADARLTLVARDEDELRRAADDIRSREPDAEVLTAPGDVGVRADAERAVSAAIDRYGRVDVLINNAGVIQVGPLDHMKLADYEHAMRTHFWGPLFLTLAALPHMRSQGGGRIANVSSIGGRVSVPHLLPYSASKFALTGLSDGLRAELAGDGIVVTTVCPGLMRVGSPVNATFKGQRASEYSWFAVSSTLPVMTIGAERAARLILAACRRGDAELVFTIPAKVAALARAVAPGIVGGAMSLFRSLLPRAVGPEGDIAKPGRSAGSGWRSAALAPMYAAALRNNEL